MAHALANGHLVGGLGLTGAAGIRRRPARHPHHGSDHMADGTAMSEAERAKLLAQRDKLMKLLSEGGSDLDADDRADLTQEWNKLDQILQRTR
jgi:hypothetical protein